MKKLLLTLTMVLSVMALSAQNFQVLYENQPITSGQTFYVYGDGSAAWGVPGDELVIDFYVSALDRVRLIGQKVENNIVEGTMNYFCFGSCFEPSIYENPEPVQLDPNGDPELFSMHYMASDYMAVIGEEQNMTYYLYEASDPDNKFEINVIFKYSLDGVEGNNMVEEFSSAYPVPASDVVNFDYSFNSNVNSAMVAVYNMMGQEVLRGDISSMSGRLSLNVSGLADGVYFYSLVVNGKTEKSSKLVVRH